MDPPRVERRMCNMNRRSFVVGAFGLVVAPRAIGAATGGGIVALVTADLEAHVVAVDVSSGRVVKRIRTPRGPRSIESTPFGQVLVAHTSSGRVTLLDATDLRVSKVLNGFGEPRYTAMHTSERLAYVTDSRRREVITVDLVAGRIVHRAAVPGPARHLSLDAGRAVLWTALGTKATDVAVLSLTRPRRPELVRVVSPPFRAHDVALAPDGRHVWVTSGSTGALAIYGLAGPPRLLRAGAPPQHVAFTDRHALVASGADGTVELRRLDGTLLGTDRVPAGSYNVAFGAWPRGRRAAITPSLDRGTLCVLTPGGRVRLVRRVARSAHDACLVEAG